MKGLFLGISLLLLGAPVGMAGPAAKPRPPLQITIAPVQAGVTSDTIRPGTATAFVVSARSLVDTETMRITVELQGGARLVTGDTSWIGPARKNEVIRLYVTVASPAKGAGSIRARVSVAPARAARFTAQARFLLGPTQDLQPIRKGVRRQGRAGRSIIEYR